MIEKKLQTLINIKKQELVRYFICPLSSLMFLDLRCLITGQESFNSIATFVCLIQLFRSLSVLYCGSVTELLYLAVIYLLKTIFPIL